jgi:hypothetical protein
VAITGLEPFQVANQAFGSGMLLRRRKIREQANEPDAATSDTPGQSREIRDRAQIIKDPEAVGPNAYQGVANWNTAQQGGGIAPPATKLDVVQQIDKALDQDPENARYLIAQHYGIDPMYVTRALTTSGNSGWAIKGRTVDDRIVRDQIKQKALQQFATTGPAAAPPAVRLSQRLTPPRLPNIPMKGNVEYDLPNNRAFIHQGDQIISVQLPPPDLETAAAMAAAKKGERPGMVKDTFSGGMKLTWQLEDGQWRIIGNRSLVPEKIKVVTAKNVVGPDGQPQTRYYETGPDGGFARDEKGNITPALVIDEYKETKPQILRNFQQGNKMGYAVIDKAGNYEFHEESGKQVPNNNKGLQLKWLKVRDEKGAEAIVGGIFDPATGSMRRLPRLTEFGGTAAGEIGPDAASGAEAGGTTMVPAGAPAAAPAATPPPASQPTPAAPPARAPAPAPAAALTMPWQPPAPVPGMVEQGNIDLGNRPAVRNPDGSISTVRSIGVNLDGKETLLPTVSDDGRIMSTAEAVRQYRATGQHLGKFTSVAASDQYAQALHESQAKMLEGAPGAPDIGPLGSKDIRTAQTWKADRNSSPTWLSAQAEPGVGAATGEVDAHGAVQQAVKRAAGEIASNPPQWAVAGRKTLAQAIDTTPKLRPVDAADALVQLDKHLPPQDRFPTPPPVVNPNPDSGSASLAKGLGWKVGDKPPTEPPPITPAIKAQIAQKLTDAGFDLREPYVNAMGYALATQLGWDASGATPAPKLHPEPAAPVKPKDHSRDFDIVTPQAGLSVRG